MPHLRREDIKMVACHLRETTHELFLLVVELNTIEELRIRNQMTRYLLKLMLNPMKLVRIIVFSSLRLAIHWLSKCNDRHIGLGILPILFKVA